MGRVEGKVAFVTGAARGQGRAQAVRLAEEGADVIAVDLCGSLATTVYPPSSPADLEETAAAIRSHGRRVVTSQTDVRDGEALRAALAEGVRTLGRLDIVVANAGIFSVGTADQLTDELWQEMIDVNLTGVWQTCKAAIPHLIEGGNGGAIVINVSAAGLHGYGNISHYVAAKHGANGLMKSLAVELGPHRIRVNSTNPSTVNSPMVMNDAVYELFIPGKEHPTRDDFARQSASMHLLPVPWVEPEDVANAVLFLSSDEARYITGAALPVDAGSLTNGPSTTGWVDDAAMLADGVA